MKIKTLPFWLIQKEEGNPSIKLVQPEDLDKGGGGNIIHINIMHLRGKHSAGNKISVTVAFNRRDSFEFQQIFQLY